MFSYDPSKIPANGRDRIRFELGDTDSANPLLDNAEIDAVISVEGGSFYRAAAMCAFTIARKFSREVSYSVGSLRVDLAARARSYREMADVLMAQARREGSVPYPVAGGLPADDTQVEAYRGVHDYPGEPPYRGDTRSWQGW